MFDALLSTPGIEILHHEYFSNELNIWSLSREFVFGNKWPRHASPIRIRHYHWTFLRKSPFRFSITKDIPIFNTFSKYTVFYFNIYNSDNLVYTDLKDSKYALYIYQSQVLNLQTIQIQLFPV